MEYVIITLGVIFVAAFVFYKFANQIIGFPIKVKSLILCAGCAAMLSLVVPRIIVNFAGFLGTLGVLAIIAIICAYFIAYYDSVELKNDQNLGLHCEEVLSGTKGLFDSEVRTSETKSEIIRKTLEDNHYITSEEVAEYNDIITTLEADNQVTNVAATITYTEKLHKEVDIKTVRHVDEYCRLEPVEDEHLSCDVIIGTESIEQMTGEAAETINTSKETSTEVDVKTSQDIYEQCGQAASASKEFFAKEGLYESINANTVPFSNEQQMDEAAGTITYNEELHREEVITGQDIGECKQEESSSLEVPAEDVSKSDDDNVDSLTNEQATDEADETINYNEEIHLEEVKAQDTDEQCKQEESSSLEVPAEDVSKSEDDNVASLTNEATDEAVETITDNEEIIVEVNKISHNVKEQCQGEVSTSKEDTITQQRDSYDIIIAPEYIQQIIDDVTEPITTSKEIYTENVYDDQDISELCPSKVNAILEYNYNDQTTSQTISKINTIEFEADKPEPIIVVKDSKRYHVVDVSSEMSDGQIVLTSTVETMIVNDSSQYIKTGQHDEVVEDFNVSIDAIRSDKPTLDELMDYAFKQKESKNFERSLKAFRQALNLYPECDAAPFLILEIATIQKKAGRLDEAIATFGEGRRIASNIKNASLEKEFIDAIAYLRIVKNVLVQHDMYCIPYHKIPADIMDEVDKEFLEWRKLI